MESIVYVALGHMNMIDISNPYSKEAMKNLKLVEVLDESQELRKSNFIGFSVG